MQDDKLNKLLRKIELQHNSIEALEKQVKQKKEAMHTDSQLLLTYLDLLGVKSVKLPNGFKAQEKVYIDFEIADKKAFFNWLKLNFTPDIIIDFLTPPTKVKDLRELILKKYESCLNTIDGILIKYEYVTLNFTYPKTQKEHEDEYKKKQEYRKGFTEKRRYGTGVSTK